MGQVINAGETISELIASLIDIRNTPAVVRGEYAVIVFARKLDGAWQPSSPALRFVMGRYTQSQDEFPALKIDEFDYFLGDSIIRNLYDDYSRETIQGVPISLVQIVSLIIYYATNDYYADPNQFFGFSHPTNS